MYSCNIATDKGSPAAKGSPTPPRPESRSGRPEIGGERRDPDPEENFPDSHGEPLV